MTIKIQKLSKDKLTKYEYCFDIRGDQLFYTSYCEYNRNTKKEKWADEEPEPLTFKEWCEKNNYYFDYDNYYTVQNYKKYCDELNPVLQKTKNGKPRLKGIIAQIRDLPKCPPDVVNAAALEFCLRLKVIYE